MSAQHPFPRVDDRPDPPPVRQPGYRDSARPIEVVGSWKLVERPKPHKGPRKKCPACGNAERLAPYRRDVVADQVKACRGRSWFVRFFIGGCCITELHLHQHCMTCGATWICEALEETP